MENASPPPQVSLGSRLVKGQAAPRRIHWSYSRPQVIAGAVVSMAGDSLAGKYSYCPSYQWPAMWRMATNVVAAAQVGQPCLKIETVHRPTCVHWTVGTFKGFRLTHATLVGLVSPWQPIEGLVVSTRAIVLTGKCWYCRSHPWLPQVRGRHKGCCPPRQIGSSVSDYGKYSPCRTNHWQSARQKAKLPTPTFIGLCLPAQVIEGAPRIDAGKAPGLQVFVFARAISPPPTWRVATNVFGRSPGLVTVLKTEDSHRPTRVAGRRLVQRFRLAHTPHSLVLFPRAADRRAVLVVPPGAIVLDWQLLLLPQESVAVPKCGVATKCAATRPDWSASPTTEMVAVSTSGRQRSARQRFQNGPHRNSLVLIGLRK